MDFMKLAEGRYSVRAFSGRTVENEKLEHILNAGRLAPTAKNLQPQKIYVIKSEKGLEKINSLYKYFGSKTVLMICADRDECWKNPYTGHPSGEMDASIVATHMMLAAAEIGIGSTWVCCFDTEKAKELFNLPPEQQPLCLLPLGYPAENAEPSERHSQRKPLAETTVLI